MVDKRVLTEHEPKLTFERGKKEEGRWAVLHVHPFPEVVIA